MPKVKLNVRARIQTQADSLLSLLICQWATKQAGKIMQNIRVLSTYKHNPMVAIILAFSYLNLMKLTV